MPYRTARRPRGPSLADAPPIRWWQWRQRCRAWLLWVRVKLRRSQRRLAQAQAQVALEHAPETVTVTERVTVRASCTVRADGKCVSRKSEQLVVRRQRHR